MRSLIIVIAISLSQTAFALETKPYLTLEMAKIMADTCEAKASAEGWRKVNVAIFDDGGNLKLFRRQDGAFMHSIKIAQLKGRTSAGMPRSTRALGEFNFAKPERPYGIEQVPGLVMFQGGLPILTADGAQIGGIGVSGATGDQDEACAQAALDAIAEMLK
jgi:glc operon protein GlcG